MTELSLPRHDDLHLRSRLLHRVDFADRTGARQLAALFGMGAVAAVAVSLLDFGLRLPGHAIMRAVFPMAFGLALVPRRFGGFAMGTGAVLTAAVFTFKGFGPGLGAMTSLCVIGPCLEAAIWRARPGWRLYIAFALAGFVANLAAFVVRGTGKMSGLDRFGTRAWYDWLTIAPVSYALCGLLAGLVSACVWFRFQSDGPAERASEVAS